MKKGIILLFFLILSLFWIVWLPGSRVATDYHLTNKETQSENIYPWIWRETNVADGLGEHTGITLWAQPLHSFFALLYQFNLPFSFLTKFLVLIILTVAFLSIDKLLHHVKIVSLYKELASIFYILNTFFLLLVDGGQLALALAYAVFPLYIYFFLRLFEKANFRNRINFTLSVLAISIADLRIVFLLFIVCLVWLLFKFFLAQSKKEIITIAKEAFFSAIFTMVIIFGFHAYWITPSLFVKSLQLPQTYERVSQIDFLSFSTLLHSLTLSQPHWYKNIFGKISEVSFEFLLIPALAFAALALVRKNTHVGFWAIIAILGIFLSKGSNPPLTQIYPFLFTYIPGLSVFRDPVKFYFLICISYTILIAFSLQAIGKFFKLAPLIFIIFLIWMIRPLYLGQMSGLFSEPFFQREHNELANSLKEDNNFARVFWIPTVSPLGYANPDHPQLEASRLAGKRPFSSAILGTYETYNFLREAPYIGEIFDVAAVGYIAYPYIDRQKELEDFDKEKYYYTFLNQLSKLPWLSKVEYSGIPLFKVKSHQDKFFMAENIWWVIGDDSVYEESTKSAKLKLSQNGMVFVEEQVGLGRRLGEVGNAKIVLNKKTTVDLAASFLDSSNLTFPAKGLDFDPDLTGWWKREASDLVWWRDFLKSKYGIDNKNFDLGGGWAVGEGEKKFQISNFKFQMGNTLLARVMESTRSGSLKFYQEDQLIGEVETKVSGDVNVRWFEVGQFLKDGGKLAIISDGDINVVNALAVLDKNEWDSFKDKAQKLQGRVMGFDEKNTRDVISPKVSYRKINPTKYMVNVSNLNGPAMLVFSQNYDSLWRMNNSQTPLPVFNLLNGFIVERDGQYTIEYGGQKYVNYGLIISVIFAAGLVLILIRNRKQS